MTAVRPSCTAVVVTALPVEFEALRSHLEARGAQPRGTDRSNGTVVLTYLLKGAHVPWTVHLAQVGEGNSDAGLVTQNLLSTFKPLAALLVGVAGGLKDDIVPGDVVIATKVYDIHGAKESHQGRGARPRAIDASHPLRQTALHATVRSRRHFKPIASSQIVLDIRSGSIRRRLDSTYQDAVAIEMEGFGFCNAARLSRTEALVIRGISDKADGNKSGADAAGGQQRAAANAAEAAVAVLVEHQPGRTSPARRRARELTGWWRSRPATGKKVLTGVALLLVAGIVSAPHIPPPGGTTESSSRQPLSRLPACHGTSGTLHIAASVDKSEPLRHAARAYGHRLAGGRCWGIQIDDGNSGEVMRALVDGWRESDGHRPDVWSPAGSSWLSLARATAKGRNRAQFPAKAGSIVQSPLTIAMPKPMAEALDWPERRFTWSELAEWAKSADAFWARHGHPEWGAFKLGKTNPGYSTSGLNATVAAFFAKTGTSGELGRVHLDNPANRAFVESIEQATVHYGDTTLTFLSNLRRAERGGPDKAMSYISAIALEESTVAAYDAGYPCGALSKQDGCARTAPPETPLVSFYPKDGVPFSDHPYIELNGMSAAKRAVADDFLAYLQSPQVYAGQFAPYGFRAHDGRVVKESTLLRNSHEVQPDARYTRMPMPRGDVLQHLLAIWPTLRRRANVLVVIDSSESMNDEIPGTGDTKIERLKAAEPRLFGEFSGTDRVGLVKFSDADVLGGGRDYKELVPLGPYDEKLKGGTRARLLADNVDNLRPEGATGLYDTLDAEVRTMREHYDPKAINAIVLLTDGRNEDNGSLAKEELLRRISDPGQPQIRIFTIAYGNEADENDKHGRTVLQEIADAGGGQAYDAKKAETIEQVITSVISNF
ncbi:substrate-binding domain-containing protein [Streptomyces sp. NPDC058964]|uniref:phosphorylase family protein n=1 Tax=Streptomyces sp. NPDC058964 TaxID=3346681 RepID=UPI0036882AEF